MIRGLERSGDRGEAIAIEEVHDSSTGPGGQTGDERMAALAAVARTAHERVGQFSGFDCVLAFVPYDGLIAEDLSYDASLFLTPEEQSARITEHLSSKEVRFDLILRVLKLALESEHQPAVILAGKIFARMQAAAPGAPIVRPVMYIVSAPGGIAIALAIHDAFWTDKW
jgi:hypothetical protein